MIKVKNILKRYQIWFLVGVLSLIFMIPMINRGIPSGHDLIYHFSRIVGTYASLINGVFPAKILPGFYYDYGYPVNIFYSMGLFNIPVFLMIAGLDLILSYKVFVFIINALTLIVMFWSTKRLLKSNHVAILAMVIYGFSIYRTYTDFFERAALGEWMAFLFIPLVFSGFVGITHGERKSWLVLALGMSGLILSHTISFVLMTIILTLYMVYSFNRLENKKNFIKELGFAIGFVVFITAYYWMPLIEMMMSDTFQYQFPWANFQDYVLNNPNQLVYVGPQLAAFPNGIEVWIYSVLLMGLVFFRKKLFDDKIIYFSLIVIFVSFLIVSNIIPATWLKFLNFVQFPFRFSILIVYFSALVTAYILNQFKWKKIISIATLVVSISSYLYAVEYYYQVRMFGYWYDQFPRYSIEHYYAEFLPESANMDELIEKANQKIVVANNPIDMAFERSQQMYTINFDQEMYKNTVIEVPLLYYIGYVAQYYDGERYSFLPIEKSSNSLIEVQLGTNQQGSVYVFYNGTRIQKYSAYLSLAFLILWSLYEGTIFIQKRVKRMQC